MGLTDYLARARIFSLLSQNNSSNIPFTSYINHLIVLDILRFISSHKDRFFYYVCRILNSLHTDYSKNVSNRQLQKLYLLICVYVQESPLIRNLV